MKRSTDLCCRALRVGLALVVAVPAAWANPSGGVVTSGSATIGSSGSTLTINQTTDRAIINWSDFSIASGETTRFVQPSATSAALNRVTSANPSSILGTLSANGQIYLINPNGITVGAGGVINTQSFIASTLGLTDSQFLAGGDMTFSGSSQAGVVNAGQITALGGDVLLVGRTVRNTGTLTSQNGTTGLAAGSQVLFATGGNQRVFVQAGSGSGGTGVDQQGQIQAASAELAAAGGNVYALAINNDGPLTVNRVRMTGDRIAIAGNTVTNGDQVYTGAVTAQNSVTLTSNSGALTFNGSVSEGFDLTTNSALNTTFNGAVTAYGRLNSNTTTPSGAVVINGGSVFSGNDQIYNGAVRLGADTTLTSPYGSVIFNSAPLDGPYALVVNSGLNTTFQRAVGGTSPLSSLTVNITSQYGRTRPNGGLVRTTGDQVYNGPVHADNDAALTSTSGALTFNGAVSEGFDLTTNSAQNTNFNGPVTAYGRLHSNTTTPSGAVVINGGSVFSGGDQIYNGAVLLGANTTLTSPYGGVIFNSAPVDGPYALVSNSGLNTTFQRAVGAATPLSSLTVNITSQYGRIRPNGGLVRTTGDQVYNGPVYADNDATVTSTAGNLNFNGTVNAGFSLVTNSALNTYFNGPVSLGNSLTTNGTVILQGGPVTSGGDQTYNDSINVNSEMTLTSVYGNLKFNRSINGPVNHIFCGDWCDLTTNSAWNTTFNGGIVSVNPTVTAHEIFLNGGGILTDAIPRFNGPVMLGSDTTFSGDPMAVFFNGTVDGPYKLIAGGKGGVAFNAAVGSIVPLAGIEFSGHDFSARLNGGSVTTVGDQTYSVEGNTVHLGADTTLTSTAGSLHFLGKVDGAHDLTTTSSGDTDFFQPVGSETPLSSLTANITGSGSINKHGNTITTTGTQTYNGPVNP